MAVTDSNKNNGCSLIDSDGKVIDPTADIDSAVTIFPERIRLLQDEFQAIYAIGWSRYDLLVEVEQAGEGVVATNRPLGGFMTHAPRTFARLDHEILKRLWRERSLEGDLPEHWRTCFAGLPTE